MMSRSAGPRSDLYHFLAEALSEPPAWLASAGREWPLFEAARQVAFESEAARKAVLAMLEIPGEPLAVRRARYGALFAGRGRPQIWACESGATSGRLMTDETLDVEQWYRLAGLNVMGAELPDHVSLELDFLSYLAGAEQDDFARIERGFIQRHAGRWLPGLGRALQASGDPVYGLIGCLLWEWLEEAGPPEPVREPSIEKSRSSFQLIAGQKDRLEDCTLCGFCVQHCPVKALRIVEDGQTTSLQLLPNRCVGCSKCIRVCDPGVLELEDAVANAQDVPAAWMTLRPSPRVACKGCGTPMVSLAEYQFIFSRLGHPTWLEYCQECRPVYLGAKHGENQ